MGLFVAVFVGNVAGRVKPYAVNIGLRFLETMAMGHTLRFFTYIGTTLPGASHACLSGSKFETWTAPPPDTIGEIFTRVPTGHPATNCGDLVFSGHIFRTWTIVLLIMTYCGRVYRLKPGPERLVKGIVIVTGLVQLPLVIAARNHYTVDCVVASYLGPLFWYWQANWWSPKDLTPAEARDMV